MDSTSDVVQFLRSRRARITPEQAGLPGYGRRQVPGLRREEVASLAGVSVEYYRRLERGNLSGVSDLVLEALARALRLDDAERAHLFDLARAASPLASRWRRPAHERVRPVIQQVLDSIQLPAIVGNMRVDWLAANRLGHALCAPVFDGPIQPPNAARFTFLDPSAIDFYPDWQEVADQLVAHLRSATGHEPHDRDLSDLVDELATGSVEFRSRWSAHDVRFHRNRHQADPPPGRRRPGVALRDDAARRRSAPAERLHRRSGLHVPARTRCPGELDRHARSVRSMGAAGRSDARERGRPPVNGRTPFRAKG
jgi:transcriptional regulator with XRE-family HTH domain